MNIVFTRRLIVAGLVAALLLLAIPALAQDDIPLEDFTSSAFGISGVRPADWPEVQPGTYGRDSASGDPTALFQQALAGGRIETLQQSLRPGLRVDTWPEADETVITDALTWELYQIDVETPQITVRTMTALAQGEGVAYLVLLQALPDDFEMLVEAVFMPAVEALRPIAREPEPVEDLPYIAEDVTFDNVTADGETITLAGTLTLPPTDGPHPAVILISGSGPSDRDESLEPIASIRPFRLIADYLTREGVAVLRYDDRGVGESTGDHFSAHSGDLATDTEAAVRYLLSRDDINPEQIGLLGHSEGGLIATIVAARNDDVAFMISMAGSKVRGAEILIFQNERIMRASGMDEAEVAETMVLVEAIYEHVLAEDWEALEAALVQLGASEQLPVFQDVWLSYFIRYDPTPDLEQITIPVLGLFGELDVQVDAAQNVSALEAAMAVAGNEDVTIVVFPDGNHLFQSAITGAVEEYGTLEQDFLPEFMPTIAEWLLQRVDIQGE